jgi:hypothetical protein
VLSVLERMRRIGKDCTQALASFIPGGCLWHWTCALQLRHRRNAAVPFMRTKAAGHDVSVM